ncbi:MAG: PAS domain S-box protein, partial [Dissulfuribacterales bacterium]
QIDELHSRLEEREDQAALFRIVSENMLDMVALTDMEGKFTFAGKSHEILGYEPDDLIGKNVMDFVHPEDLPGVLEEFGASVASGHPRRVEYRYRCKDGTHIWLETIGNFIKDENGIPQEIVFSSKDITDRKRAEEALAKQKQILTQAEALAELGSWEWDIIKDTWLFSDNWVNIHGCVNSQLSTRRLLPIAHHEDRPAIEKSFARAVKNGEPYDIEHRIIRQDTGEIRYVYAKGIVEFDDSSKPKALVGSVQDITERKQVEETLRESEERFRVLSEASFEGIVIHENGIIIDVNKTFTELFGYEYDQIIGMNLLELATPECRNRIKQNILSEFEGAYEAMGLRKDGSTFPGELRGRKITYKGRTVRITAGRDLSEQKKTEEELRRSEEKYRILVEMANDAIFVTQDGKMKFINSQTEAITGLSKEELIERPFYDLIHPEDRDMVLDRHKRRISGEDLPNIYTFRVINRAGEVVWVELSTALFNWEERPATINFLRDITQQKNLQAQLRQSQKMEAIGTLAGGIAHDFNNILSSVLGYTELSMDEVEKGSLLHQNLSQVLSSGNRAKDLVQQILALSRKEAQEFIPTPIVPLVKEALKMFRSTFPSSIEIKENISIEKGIVYAEPTQLHQLIINLATNAKQAMSDGGGVLEVTVETVNFDENIEKKYPAMVPGKYVRIFVSDTGCGISEQDFDRVFEPYFTTSETGTGTGLGLSLVHGIVKSHSGHIAVYSEPGEGTTFQIYLPLAQQERSFAASTVQKDEALPTGTESILLVDDEKPIVEMLQQTLEILGYHVTSRTSSVEALEVFRANPYKFDLLVTDAAMPNMTGDKLALRVKEIGPDIPVILCTGFSEKIKDQQRKDLGIEGFLMKPVTKKDMAEAVRNVLDGK